MDAPTRAHWLLSLTAAAATGMVAMWFLGAVWPRPLPVAAPLVSLEKMGHLVSVRVSYSDVIEFTEKNTIDMPFNREIRLADTKALLVARGDCIIATDLNRASYVNIDPEKRTLTLALTAPQALSVRINHEGRDRGGSYFYSMTENGFAALIADPGRRTRAIDNALAKAQSELTRACLSATNLASARQNAETVLRAIYVATGWTPAFTWKPQAAAASQ